MNGDLVALRNLRKAQALLCVLLVEACCFPFKSFSRYRLDSSIYIKKLLYSNDVYTTFHVENFIHVVVND